jgi:hypothetical protein
MTARSSLESAVETDDCAAGVIGAGGIFLNKNARESQRATRGGQIIEEGTVSSGLLWGVAGAVPSVSAVPVGITIVSSAVVPAGIIFVVSAVGMSIGVVAEMFMSALFGEQFKDIHER